MCSKNVVWYFVVHLCRKLIGQQKPLHLRKPGQLILNYIKNKKSTIAQ